MLDGTSYLQLQWRPVLLLCLWWSPTLCWRWRSYETASSLCLAWLTFLLQTEQYVTESVCHRMCLLSQWFNNFKKLRKHEVTNIFFYLTWDNFQKQHEFQSIPEVLLNIFNLNTSFPQVGVTPGCEGLTEKGIPGQFSAWKHFSVTHLKLCLYNTDNCKQKWKENTSQFENMT